MPLRIPLCVTEEEPPFVTAQAYWLRKGTKDRVDFLVDTGAWVALRCRPSLLGLEGLRPSTQREEQNEDSQTS